MQSLLPILSHWYSTHQTLKVMVVIKWRHLETWQRSITELFLKEKKINKNVSIIPDPGILPLALFVNMNSQFRVGCVISMLQTAFSLSPPTPESTWSPNHPINYATLARTGSVQILDLTNKTNLSSGLPPSYSAASCYRAWYTEGLDRIIDHLLVRSEASQCYSCLNFP